MFCCFFSTIFLLLFDRFSSFVFHFFCWVFSYSFFFLSIFLLCIFLFFPSCVHFSLFLKNVCLCLFRFCHFPSVSISFNKISRFFCFILIVSNIFKNKFLFLWTFNLIFGIPCYQKKSPCSNFHFDRAHSYTYVSRFFFYLLTLFMFPLLCVYPTDVRSLCLSTLLIVTLPFLLPKFFHKKTFLSLSLLENLRASFQSPSSFTLFISFSETPSVVLLLFWFRLFSLLHFPSLFFRKITFLSPFFFLFFFFKIKKNLSHEKHSLFFLSSNVSCILFSSLFVFVHHVSHSPLFFVSVFA